MFAGKGTCVVLRINSFTQFIVVSVLFAGKGTRGPPFARWARREHTLSGSAELWLRGRSWLQVARVRAHVDRRQILSTRPCDLALRPSRRPARFPKRSVKRTRSRISWRSQT